MAHRTQYARNGEVNIAYQVVGEGPLDLVVVPGFISHLDLDWTLPEFAAFLERLASFSRLIRLDKRGTGLSDPVPGVPTLEERMEDARRARRRGVQPRHPVRLLGGRGDGGAVRGDLSRAHGGPDPVRELSQRARHRGRADAVPRGVRRSLGRGHASGLLLSQRREDPRRRSLAATYERAAASPGMARALLAATEATDVSGLLGSVRVPTLVLHRREEYFPVAVAREMAAQIPGARFVELEGVDHLPFVGDSEAVIGEIEEFVTGARQAPPVQRGLATVLFTDIVGSTERAAQLGDARWRELLDAHNELVRARVEAAGGRAVKSTGDGFLAVFDGPARAIRCAQELAAAVVDEVGLETRAGIHTGECELMGDDVGGIAVHIGARVSATAGAGEVVVSSTVTDLVVGSGIAFADRGETELKGVPGRWRLYLAGEEDSSTAAIDDRRSLRTADRVSLALARRAPRVARAMVRTLAGDSQRSDARSG